MEDTPTVVALCGSLREHSYTRTALGHVLAAARDAGAETELVDFREVDLPMFNPDIDEQGESVEFLRTVREADAVVFGSPVYHNSYSATLKNALDYCGFDEFENTTVGLLAVAGGGSYGSTLDHMRIVARGVHAWVLPHQVGIRGASGEFDDGEFTDENLAARVAQLGTKAVEYADIRPRPVHADEADSD